MGVGVKKPNSNFFLVVNYVNKHVEYINFRKIFSNTDVSAASPFKSDNISAPSISYHYPKTIRSKVLNYKEAYDEYCDPNTLSCDCNSSAYQGHLFIAVVVKSRNLQFSATNREIGVFPRRTAKSTIFRDKSRYNLFSATDREISCLCKLKFRSLKLDQTLYNLTKRYKT